MALNHPSTSFVTWNLYMPWFQTTDRGSFHDASSCQWSKNPTLAALWGQVRSLILLAVKRIVIMEPTCDSADLFQYQQDGPWTGYMVHHWYHDSMLVLFGSNSQL
ncbi:hypothetical protein HAX54_017017 [Datura stramonium]|uniref:Uncharacterized protein n=1 Tax=Datura stramonium TaxID=4076 RepID=A0ABS8S066_DATST|nr:hypothetical protein [Datura stramonium]